MNENKMFGIYIPSYNRADTISTHKLLEYYKVVVRKSQKEDYLKVIPEENLIAVDDEEICSVSKVWNWVIDNAEEEVIAILGDDMSGCLYRLDFNVPIEDYSLITAEIERIAQLIYDLDIGYGCDDATNTPWNYNQEFAFTGTTGGITWVNRKVYKSRYNDAIGYCSHSVSTRIILCVPICSRNAAGNNRPSSCQSSRITAGRSCACCMGC